MSSIEEHREKLDELSQQLVTLNKQKDKIVGRVAVEEQRRAEAVKNLKDYGHDVENMSIQELKDLRTKLESELDTEMVGIEQLITETKGLVVKFQER